LDGRFSFLDIVWMNFSLLIDAVGAGGPSIFERRK